MKRQDAIADINRMGPRVGSTTVEAALTAAHGGTPALVPVAGRTVRVSHDFMQGYRLRVEGLEHAAAGTAPASRAAVPAASAAVSLAAGAAAAAAVLPEMPAAPVIPPVPALRPETIRGLPPRAALAAGRAAQAIPGARRVALPRAAAPPQQLRMGSTPRPAAGSRLARRRALGMPDMGLGAE